MFDTIQFNTTLVLFTVAVLQNYSELTLAKCSKFI